jgi:hypothetical protein
MGFAIAFIVFSSQGNEISTLSIDGSLRSKELVDPNAPMSSEEAIKKLKAYKEKLDLGLISQEEYDSYNLHSQITKHKRTFKKCYIFASKQD